MHDSPRYKLLNFAAAGVATLLLYGTAAAIALREPPARSEPEAHVETNFPLATDDAIALPIVAARLPMFAVPFQVPESLTVGRLPTPSLSAFQLEQRMSYGQLMKRWEPFIAKAAKRFGVPAAWIRKVMEIESGGRTMTAENVRIVSGQGALGLMQIQRGTYAEMRAQYRLGPDPFDPHDNIFAGAAYLRWLRGKYGYPMMFEAYDDGPGNLEQRMTNGALLPAETRNYVNAVVLALGGKIPPGNVNTAASAVAATTTGAATNSLHQVALGTWCGFTRPDGSPLVIDCTLVHSVRAPSLEENAPDVKSVLTVGTENQAVRESEETVRQIVLSRGGRV